MAAFAALLVLCVSVSQAADNPAAAAAYEALKQKDYDQAIAAFREAIQAEPDRMELRKELAYTLLKVGETEPAREVFGEIVRLAPKDWHSALEYGYLCHETRRVLEARRVFDRVRKQGDAASRSAAETAFANVDRPLADAMSHWFRALTRNPGDYSAHVELANAAADRDEWKAAAEHFQAAWALKPVDRQILVELGVARKESGDLEGAHGAWLAATRGAQSRAAEKARELLPSRYPYAAEFRRAIDLDPNNVDLRRELAFLYLAVNQAATAEAEFRKAIEIAPTDLLSLAQLGLLRLARGDREGAMPYLGKVLQGKDPVLAQRVQDALNQKTTPAVPAPKGNPLPTPQTVPPPPRRDLPPPQPIEYKSVPNEKTPASPGLRTAPPSHPPAAEPPKPIKANPSSTAAPARVQPSPTQAPATQAPATQPAVTQPSPPPPAKSAPAGSAPSTSTPPPSKVDNPKALGDKSYTAGYLQDALRYYELAELDRPNDPDTQLKLGFTHNMLHQDAEAIRYFDLARKSADPKVRQEARRAYQNLRPGAVRFRSTAWLFPMFSSRWHEAFSYGQWKVDMRLGKLPFRPYLTTRLVADSQRSGGSIQPQYLSESSFIFGLGLATNPWHGLSGWAEAGTAVRYRERNDVGRMIPDYRGGLSWSKGFGRRIHSESPGLFFETTADMVLLSRFRWNLLFYSQNRTGFTLPPVAGLQSQVVWNLNLTGDRNREAWANFIDLGPGLRFRTRRMPPSMVWSLDLLRGNYLIHEGNPRKPVYYDIRAGVWYAITR